MEAKITQVVEMTRQVCSSGARQASARDFSAQYRQRIAQRFLVTGSKKATARDFSLPARLVSDVLDYLRPSQGELLVGAGRRCGVSGAGAGRAVERGEIVSLVSYGQAPECRHDMTGVCCFPGCKTRFCLCHGADCEECGAECCDAHHRTVAEIVERGTLQYRELCMKCCAERTLDHARSEVAALNARIIEEDLDLATITLAVREIADSLAVAA